VSLFESLPNADVCPSLMERKGIKKYILAVMNYMNYSKSTIIIFFRVQSIVNSYQLNEDDASSLGIISKRTRLLYCQTICSYR